MELTIEREGGVAVVVLSDSVTAVHTEDLDEAFSRLLGEGVHDFVIDMSDVAVVDSAGLGSLVGLFKRVRIGPGDVRLCGLQAWVKVIFVLTRLNRVFDSFDDRAAAVASFRVPSSVDR